MTESTRTPAERCMSIMLHTILDYLELREVLGTMCVNRLWREHAINHPTYYGDLCLYNRGALSNHDLFLARLACSNGRPVSVSMVKAPLDLMQEIGNHLAHITSLFVDVSSADSVGAVLQHLCRPAPVLHTLRLRIGEATETVTAPPTLPADFLGQHAPALNKVTVMGFDLSAGIPEIFFNIKELSFFSWMEDKSGVFVLPSPFGQCPKLRELELGNNATLHHDACHAVNHKFWKRMTRVSFTASGIGRRWPSFQLPLYDVLRITVSYGDADSVLALARTLSGPLHVIFPLPGHFAASDGKPLLSFTAEMRSTSRPGGHTRVYTSFLTQYGSISAFSVPLLADRVARLELELDAWDNFVGLRTFGPFSALDELVLNLKDDTKFKSPTELAKLSCPKLQRLFLRGTQLTPTADIAAVAQFALASLSHARFPLRLALDGITLVGAWNDFPETFSNCVYRGS